MHLFIAIDQLVWVIITLGNGFPDETISAASYRYELKGKTWAKIIRPIIDFIFFLEKDHCRLAYEAERGNNHLPIDYR